MFSASKLLSLLLVPLVSCFDWQDAGSVRWAFNCDFPNADLANARTNGENCGPKCQQTAGCSHFTWTNYQGGTCWMKQGGVTEANAIGKSNDHAVCGFLKTNPGTTAKGKSTRYWDCCKVSCGWNNKGPLSAPVKSCQSDGHTAAGVNDPSGCDNGNSYVCSNNQPFAVNDQLSYGFAAARLTGQSEPQWCCGCYELTFTSTAVAGKRMVVQVINTGGDLGENHFDLQIPGGGMGWFDQGCPRQWGGDASRWGGRYGGIGSVGDCEKLPETLRNGCRWRFGWFKNADNPTFDFKKVACPQQITDISGCRRTD